MSLADWVRSASSIWRSLRFSPAWMGMLDSSRCSSAWYSAASSDVNVMVAPCAPAGTGWSRRITTAVVSLVREAIGTGPSRPDWALYPIDGTTTAPWPLDGHGRAGGPPGTTVAAVTAACG